MSEYAKKTCYDCGIRFPANEGARVTESYNAGRSDRRPDGANVAGFLFSDAKTSQKMLKSAFTKNNRRKYTRNRTVWKCGSCAGTKPARPAAPVKSLKEQYEEKQAKLAYQEKKREVDARNREFAKTQPLNIFFSAVNWVMLSFGGLMLLSLFLMALDGESEWSAAIIGGAFIFMMFCALPIKNLWFREYNRIKRAKS